jgi:hypothetical protein
MNTEIANLPVRSSTSAAERMRLYRKRRRSGMRTVRIQLHVTDIEALIHKGYLDHKSRDDRDAVEFAISSFVDDALTNQA